LGGLCRKKKSREPEFPEAQRKKNRKTLGNPLKKKTLFLGKRGGGFKGEFYPAPIRNLKEHTGF